MEFRIAERNDCAALAQLRWNARFEEDGEAALIGQHEFLPACERFFLQGLQDGSHVCWLAVEGETIVSHICVQVVPMIPRPLRIEDRFGYLTNSYTLPDHRSRGIGSRLLNYVIDWARQEDLELLIVWPSERAVPFYARSKFSEINDVMQLTLRPYDAPNS